MKQYTIEFEINGVRSYTEAFTFEEDAERELEKIEEEDNVENARISTWNGGEE